MSWIKKKYEKRNRRALALSKQSIPSDLGNIINNAIKTKASEIPNVKVISNSRTILSVKVTNHGYVIVPNQSNKNELVRPSVTAKVTIIHSNSSDPLLSNEYIGSSTIQAPLTSFVINKKLSRRAFISASNNLASQIKVSIAKKMGQSVSVNTPTPEVIKDRRPDNSVPQIKKGYPVKQLKPVQSLAFNRKKPYPITRHLNYIHEPTKKITLGGYTMKLASSADGKILLIAPKNRFDSRAFRTNQTPEYFIIKNYLKTKGIRLLRQRDLKNISFYQGFFLELDGDGYTALSSK